MVHAALLCAVAGGIAASYEVPPYCAALGRSLSWDPKGAFPLDVERKLSPFEKQIVECLASAELGRAENLAAFSLRTNRNDLVPAWALGQIARVRKRALTEYERLAPSIRDSNGSVPTLLYQLHICRLAEEELPPNRRNSGDALFRKLKGDQTAVRDLCLPWAKAYLGVAVAVAQFTPYWVLEGRTALLDYQAAHPKSPDVRPLICQAYLTGLHVGSPQTFLTPKATAPEEPQPQKALTVAKSILRNRPDDPLGHYYVGASQFLLRKTDLAVREFQTALSTDRLPPLYEQAARAFVEHPGFPALRPKVNY